MCNLFADRTTAAVTKQIAAMGSDLLEIGVFKPEENGQDSSMLLRTWDAETLVRSIPWLRHQNREGRNIYIRPKGEHNLSLVDDLKRENLAAMRQAGFAPATVVETSPGNYQAWLKHSQQLDRETSTATARMLAEKFGGDRGSADWRHFGRLSGFTNRKSKYLNIVTGLYPFVRLTEASGQVCVQADAFLGSVKDKLARDKAEREKLRQQTDRRAVWKYHQPGGYGYVIPVPCLILGKTQSRTRIRVMTKSGEFQERLVAPENLRSATKEDVQAHGGIYAKLSQQDRTKLKTIEAFRSNPRYGGDGTRIDLAYAVYALDHGVSAADVASAIRSRDLSHKGNPRRQDDYVERTIKKAEREIGAGLGR
jgi:hypothetical protein